MMAGVKVKVIGNSDLVSTAACIFQPYQVI